MKQQWSRRGLSAVWLMAAVASGCGDDGSTTNNVSTAGSTGAVAGAAPAAGGAGASAPAAAGSTAGGAAGGGAAMPGTGGGDFTCGPASTKAPAELYAAAAGALLPPTETSTLPCAFGPCHNANKKIAGLELAYGGKLTDLVGKPSCQAPSLSLVAAGGGSDALSKSWLYLKLAAPVDGSAALIPDPSWGTANNSCGQTTGDFGVRMPFSAGSDGIGADKLAMIRDWICAGAPAGM